MDKEQVPIPYKILASQLIDIIPLSTDLEHYQIVIEDSFNATSAAIRTSFDNSFGTGTGKKVSVECKRDIDEDQVNMVTE